MLVNLLIKVLYSCELIVTRLRKSKITGMNLDHDLAQLVTTTSPVVPDIWANQGQSIQQYRRIVPKSRIHSFEPTSSMVSILR